MTQDEILAMAREAFEVEVVEALIDTHKLERFAALVAAHEREKRENMNLNCKSVQARLATTWGYVKAEQAKQEPVAFIGQGLLPIVPEDLEKLRKHEPGMATLYDTPLYAAPVRTKDLTDDEIHKLVKQVRFDGMTDRTFQFARAVIAADREKNK